MQIPKNKRLLYMYSQNKNLEIKDPLPIRKRVLSEESIIVVTAGYLNQSARYEVEKT